MSPCFIHNLIVNTGLTIREFDQSLEKKVRTRSTAVNSPEDEIYAVVTKASTAVGRIWMCVIAGLITAVERPDGRDQTRLPLTTLSRAIRPWLSDQWP